MEFIRGLHNVRARHRGCVMTIGNFDGLHLGHRAILDRLRQEAERQGVPGLVMMFEPQPLEYFAPDRAPARLTSLREKIKLLARAGIDRLLCLRFDSELAAWTGVEFVQGLLVDALAARTIIIGDDFRFGQGRDGDLAMLERLGGDHDFSVVALETCDMGGERVSSSRVREVLAAGDLSQAARLLGRPYSISGRVIHGDRRGRELGMPTLNIDLKRPQPALTGVFVSRVHGLSDDPLPAISYIGKRPVFGGDRFVLETHILDYRDECYGRCVEVEFMHKLRDDRLFDSAEELRRQMLHDVEQARGMFQRGPRNDRETTTMRASD